MSRSVIEESLYYQVDSEGHESLYLAEIIDHKTSGAVVTKDDGYTTSNDRRVPRRTTVGWENHASGKINPHIGSRLRILRSHILFR